MTPCHNRYYEESSTWQTSLRGVFDVAIHGSRDLRQRHGLPRCARNDVSPQTPLRTFQYVRKSIILNPTQPKPTMTPKQPCTYIMASAKNGTLYTGVTSNLVQRVYQHKTKTTHSFAHKYNCSILVWYELHENMITAIEREKQIKSGNRQRKIALIEALNPQWSDLYESISQT